MKNSKIPGNQGFFLPKRVRYVFLKKLPFRLNAGMSYQFAPAAVHCLLPLLAEPEHLPDNVLVVLRARPTYAGLS
jgi:hypothetical protein